jgi:hypothetical protein
MICINQENAEITKEPYSTLATCRQFKVCLPILCVMENVYLNKFYVSRERYILDNI